MAILHSTLHANKKQLIFYQKASTQGRVAARFGSTVLKEHHLVQKGTVTLEPGDKLESKIHTKQL